MKKIVFFLGVVFMTHVINTQETEFTFEDEVYVMDRVLDTVLNFGLFEELDEAREKIFLLIGPNSLKENFLQKSRHKNIIVPIYKITSIGGIYYGSVPFLDDYDSMGADEFFQLDYMTYEKDNRSVSIRLISRPKGWQGIIWWHFDFSNIQGEWKLTNFRQSEPQ
ncbi:MAG: hypothetical protein LBG42_04135 [Treponema sp.]|jgi:hypothetical protein|nr:hypothetical protein [Treponema sp.]